MNQPFIIGNWKMHGLMAQARDLTAEIILRLSQNKLKAEVVLCPPFPYLGIVHHRLVGTSLHLGAQDVSANSQGAFTGDVSAGMLVDIGCKFVIIGHSERRQFHHEDGAEIQAKVQAAQQAGLKVILCVGEQEEDQQAGRSLAVVQKQLEEALLPHATAENLIIAYEPIWAIGTGKTATLKDLRPFYEQIRSFVNKILKEGERIPLLYGGSVKPDNAREILTCEGIQGVLVGGASLNPESFCSIAMTI